MKILLLYPPGGNMEQPYTSLPYLTSFLRTNGYEVIQRDFNIEALEYYLNPVRLKKAHNKINKKLNGSSAMDIKELCMLSEASFVAREVIQNIENAKKNLRNIDTYRDYAAYYRSRQIIKNAINLISTEFYPYKWPALETKEEIIERGDIKTYISNKNYILNEFLKNKLSVSPDENDYDLIGISITYPPQLVAGLAIAKYIRERNNTVHIVFGGALLTSVITKSQDSAYFKLLFSYSDSLIIGDGENALKALCEKIQWGIGDLSDIPNIIYKDNEKILTGKNKLNEDLNLLPPPDFDGLPLDLYLSPELVLLLAHARGCYWSKCAFCELTGLKEKKYRSRKIEMVVEDLLFLSEKYHTNYFFFSIEAFPITQLKRFCTLVREKNLKIMWQSEVRFEKALDDQMCKMLYDSGCRQLIFGFESGNQRVLDLMDKGTDLSQTSEIIKNCYDAGISVSVQSFIGFPTETKEEALDTANFLIGHSDYINSYSMGKFMLIPNSKVYRFPERYGIDKIITGETGNGGTKKINEGTVKFITNAGMTEKEVNEIHIPLLKKIDNYYPFKLGNNGIDIHALFFIELLGAGFFQEQKGIQKNNHRLLIKKIFTGGDNLFPHFSSAVEIKEIKEVSQKFSEIKEHENSHVWMSYNNKNGRSEMNIGEINIDVIKKILNNNPNLNEFIGKLSTLKPDVTGVKYFFELYNRGLIEIENCELENTCVYSGG